MTTSTSQNRLSNGHQTTMSNDDNEEDQLNRINLQALQNRDPYILKIVDQAQRVCVYKFIAEKREWERKELEGTLFVYERMCEPYHGFVILSTVSRETFVQIIKSNMEFKHTPTHEAFLQYKVDVGDIYGIWFISKNDCPRVTECLKRLTEKAKEREQLKTMDLSSQKTSNIISLLSTAQDKFQESKHKPEVNNSDTSTTAMPAVLLRLFSTQDSNTQPTMNTDDRGEELKQKLGISGKSALSVTELEKQFLHSSTSQQSEKPVSNNEYLAKPVPVAIQSQRQTTPQSISAHVMTNAHSVTMNPNLFTGFDSISTNNNNNNPLMTPAQFQTFRIAQSPVIPTQAELSSSSSCAHCQHQPQSSLNNFSRDHLRQLLVDMLQHDEDLITGLYNAYLEKQTILHRLY